MSDGTTYFECTVYRKGGREEGQVGPSIYLPCLKVRTSIVDNPFQPHPGPQEMRFLCPESQAPLPQFQNPSPLPGTKCKLENFLGSLTICLKKAVRGLL